MSAVANVLAKALEFVLAALLSVLFADLSVQIGSRFLFGRAVIWTEELSRFLLIWIVFLGAALAIHTRLHFTVELVLERLPPRVLRWWVVVMGVSLVVLVGVLLYQGVVFAELGLRSRSPSLGLPMMYVYAAVPVSMGCALIFLAAEVRRQLRSEP